MARKKRKTATTCSKESDFSHTPFRDLKGVSVCRAVHRESTPAAEPPQLKGAQDKPADEALFLEEMALLRVKASRGQDDGGDVPACAAPMDEDERGQDPQGSAQGEDQALFLSALGDMERTFVDEIPSEPSPPQASPRRMRELNRGRRRPEAELDLHGLDRIRARERVRHFLDNCRHQGLSTVLVITGRGLHSGDEPVLRTDLESFLAEEGRTWAVEWGRAPRQYGGAGALVIFLKK